MDCDGERGLLEAMRNGERAGLASEATRKADLVEEHDRSIDLAAVEAIFVIGIVEMISVGFFALVFAEFKTLID
jgi:hypothetical protein